jgi:Kef-type K+ transport system membrane component KefB
VAARARDPFLAGFAELGRVLIMFALGLEEGSSRFVGIIKKASQ